MNRELKFRGHTGKFWVHGNLILGNVKGSELTHIEHTDFDEFRKWDVVRESVGQYTGLKDKEGKEIYEGDVIKDLLTKAIWVIRFGYCKKYAFTGWYVEFDNRQSTINNDSDSDRNSQIEIIGNIYENPELLTKDLQSSNR